LKIGGDICGLHHHRQPLALAGAGQAIESLVAPKRDSIEELQRASCDVVETDTRLLILDQMQQVLPGIFTG
jgi:hypothetical protein